MAKSSEGLAQRSPGEGPERGPSRARGGAGRAPGSAGGSAGPAFSASAAGSAGAGSAHNTSHVGATHPPSARAGGTRADWERGPEGEGSGHGLGTGHRARAPLGQSEAASGQEKRAALGVVCREGRGLLLGLAQETGRRGPSYWLPVWAACLLLAGEL